MASAGSREWDRGWEKALTMKIYHPQPLVGTAQDSQVCSPKCTQLDKPRCWRAGTSELPHNSTALSARTSPSSVGWCP